MHVTTFDHLTVTLARASTRRAVLAALLAGAGTAFGLASAERVSAQGCLDTGERCSDGDQCCSGRCRRNDGKKVCRPAEHQGACTIEVNVCAGNSIQCGTTSGAGPCFCWETARGHSFCGELPDNQSCGCTGNRACEQRLGRGAKCAAAGALCAACPPGANVCVPACSNLTNPT